MSLRIGRNIADLNREKDGGGKINTTKNKGLTNYENPP